MLKNASLGTKLIGGFVGISLFVLIVGSTGIFGLNSTANEFDNVVDRQMPLSDASMEGTINLICGRDLMGEFLLNEDKAKFAELEKEFKQCNINFDEKAEYIIRHGSEEMKDLARQAQDYHDKFEEASAAMMDQQRSHIESTEQADILMEQFDQHAESLEKMLVSYEEELTRTEKIDAKIDAAMEAKAVMFALQAIAEEYLRSRTQQQTAELRKKFKDHEAEFDALETNLPQNIINEHNDFGGLVLKMFDHHDGVLRSEAEARTMMAKLDDYSDKADKLADKIEEASGKQMQAAMERADAAEKTASRLIFAVTVLGFICAVLLGYFISQAIIRPIQKSVDFADKVAKGDLSETINVVRSDEIGVLVKSLNTMVHNLNGTVQMARRIAGGDLTVRVEMLSEADMLGTALRDMVAKLSETIAEINISANNVAAGSEQMNSTSQAMSQGATEQASSLEEISSSMNEIASQTRQNAENATQASKLSGDAMNLAEKGNGQMQHMVAAMREINDSSRNISRIIKVIDEIAFQTNLLALNAAVEAARAGKHGKGFAVVAEEVRNLAARSAKAAKETSELIENSVKKVDDGTDIADKTAEALKEIVGASAKVTDLVAEIAAASNEQAQGVAQITSGLGQIDQVTQQNTAHAEESASAAEELSSQAMVLQQLVGAFRVDARIVGQEHAGGSARENQQRMLGTSAVKNEAPGSSKARAWGGSAGIGTAGSVIALDDHEFGKY